MQQCANFAQRQDFFSWLRWESVFWLGVVAAGFAGVVLADRLSGQSAEPKIESKMNPKFRGDLGALISVVGSAVIAHILISMLAQSVKLPDERIGWVVAQPAKAQVVFAVLVGFGAAGFVVKKLFGLSYIWPVVGGAILVFYALSRYGRGELLRYVAEEHPANYFSSPLICILPVQMMAFGAIGSVAGYWLAVRYDWWRKHGTD
jgi:hypothetical protein